MYIYEKSNKKGFTLIELLVVVAIVSLLSSVIFASLNSARAKARDARRASDMKQLQIAFELYYDINGQYPSELPSLVVSSMNTGGADITPYINPIPADPVYTGNNGYRYRISNVNGRQSYSMLVHLEKNNGAWCSLSTTPGNSTWNGDPSDGSGTNYPLCKF